MFPRKAILTSLQTRTTETPEAQRTPKTEACMMDAWQGIRVRDALWNLPLRTLCLCAEIIFLQWTQFCNMKPVLPVCFTALARGADTLQNPLIRPAWVGWH